MSLSSLSSSQAGTKRTRADLLRCLLVTLISAPLAWLCASLLSQRTVPAHEKLVGVALTILILGNALQFSLRSWKNAGLFIISMLMFPVVLDRRCLLLASAAVPIVAAVVLNHRGKPRHIIAWGSALSAIVSVLAASAILSPRKTPVTDWLPKAWDVQWSMHNESLRLAWTRDRWEQIKARVHLNDLEKRLPIEMAQIWAEIRSAQDKERQDDMQAAIALYDRATDRLFNLPRLALTWESWDWAYSTCDQEAMRQFRPGVLARVRDMAAQAAAMRANNPTGNEISHCSDLYFMAQRLLLAADPQARELALPITTARSAWKIMLEAADRNCLGPCAASARAAALNKAQEAANKADEGDALGAIDLYREASKALYEAIPSNSVGMKFVLIPSGWFTMGSPDTESNRQGDETQHVVRISKPFGMGMTLVTQAQFTAVMGHNPSWFKGSDLPVENVSWTDAVIFCTKLSSNEGRTYRLPTEAEWEYACRAGTFTACNSCEGEDALPSTCWYEKNSEKHTHPVALLRANRWGLFDMHGNVYQWCYDYYARYPRADVTDPTGPASGDERVKRGGDYALPATDCRSARRYIGGLPQTTGFRVCLEMP